LKHRSETNSLIHGVIDLALSFWAYLSNIWIDVSM